MRFQNTLAALFFASTSMGIPLSLPLGGSTPSSSGLDPLSSLPDPLSSLPDPLSSLPDPLSSLPDPLSIIPDLLPKTEPKDGGSLPPKTGAPSTPDGSTGSFPTLDLLDHAADGVFPAGPSATGTGVGSPMPPPPGPTGGSM